MAKDDGIVFRGKRVYVEDGNTEIHAVWFGVYLRGGHLLQGFSGDTARECSGAKRSAIAYAKRVDKELERGTR